jgi:DNA-binding NarL/FixJ family response regulator
MDIIRIVLADDHQTVREALKLLCDAQADMTVVGDAPDGQSAIALVAALQPNVVVMDLSMPGLNGLRATALLSQRAPQTRVLALTRHAEESYVRELLRAGASGYALKQSASADLLTAIRTVAAGRQYLDPGVSRHLVDTYVRDRSKQTPPSLSGRETEVLRFIAWGHSNKDIAGRLDLSVKTVEVHKANGMRKLGLRSRIELVRYALLQGWLQES